MAVSGTVPSAGVPRFDVTQQAKRLRRVTSWLAAVAFAWFLLQFGAAWVPAGMNTVPAAPPGSWVIVDRWSIGVRVGSHVFVDGPDGRVLSQVAQIDGDSLRIEHPDPGASHRDSRAFGPLPRSALAGTVIVVFPPEGGASSHGR
jgi:type IV secretory pathway protease TraF